MNWLRRLLCKPCPPPTTCECKPWITTDDLFRFNYFLTNGRYVHAVTPDKWYMTVDNNVEELTLYWKGDKRRQVKSVVQLLKYERQ